MLFLVEAGLLHRKASDLASLDTRYSAVYIADLPGKRPVNGRSKRVTTGTAEIETY